MKWILWLVIGLLVVLFLTPFFHRWNARRVNDIRQAYITEDANVRVNTYEWFYDMHEQIEATRRKAEIAKGTPGEKGIRMVLAVSSSR